jgi:hypothetical protein
MNKPLALEMEHLSPEGHYGGNMDGGFLNGDFERFF